jgi:FkbM family methyltransferase
MQIEKIKEFIEPKRILDIGANVGGWYRECRPHFPSSYIFSIEANDECEEALKAANPNYLIALLTKDNKEYDYYINNTHQSTGNSIYKELTEHYTEANTRIIKKQGTRLDDLFKDEYFDLIKMDVQGAELDIIKGGPKLIQAAHGLILEVALKEYNQSSPMHDEIVAYLETIRFTKKLILDDLMYNNEVYHQDIFFLNENIIRN